jgi:DNA-binding winged helix-turn-helix (wHTH) protein/TolB-like protein/Tfp pilus assembly protein PilF
VPFVVHQFGDFSLDCGKFELCRKGRRLKLERKPLELLVLLVTKHGQVVTRNEIARCLWEREVFVDIEHGINTAIRKIRQILGDSSDLPQFVQTISGSGYRFIARVTAVEPEVTEPTQPSGDPVALHPAPPEGCNDPVGAQEDSADAQAESAPGAENAHEHMESPEWRRMAQLALALIVLIAAIGGVLFWKKRTLHVAAGNEQKVLAVLPFSNQTGANANSYLTEGITESLIRQFSQIPGLRVISRAAADRVNKQNAANELGVGYLLTGALEHSADGRLVLNAELSDAKNGTVLRSNQYIPDEVDLRPIQAEIVRDAVKGLGISLDTAQAVGAKRPLTSSPAAYQNFLRGEAVARLRDDPANLHEAIRNFEEAVRLDPSFAFAYSSMAEGHLVLGLYYEAPRDHMPLARQYAQRALALDPSMHHAHGILGLIDLLYDWNLPSAQRELEEADTRDNAIWQLACTAHLLSVNGRYRHAEEDLESMLEFDPHSGMLIAELGCVKYYAGHYDDSIRYYQQALSLDPRSVLGYWGMGRSLAREERYKEALEDLRRFKQLNGFEPTIITAEIGFTEAASGDRHAAMGILKQLQEESKGAYVDPYLMAVIYLGLKDRENTYAWLDRAYQSRSPFLISIATDPKWSDWRSDARFEALWNRMTTEAQS